MTSGELVKKIHWAATPLPDESQMQAKSPFKKIEPLATLFF